MTAQVALGWRRSAPDPGCGATVELLGRQTRRLVDLVGIGEGVSGERFPTEDPPPPLLQVQPAGTFRDQYLLHPRMRRQPILDRRTRMTGQIVGNQLEVPARVGCCRGIQQLEIAARVA